MEAEAEMNARHARLLGRLAELGMALAEDLAARSLAADTPDEAATLSAGFHRLSRSVRQSLALEARLRRDAARAGRQVLDEAERACAETITRRRAQVKAALARLVWTEAEDEHTARYWDEGTERLLAHAALAPDFAVRPLDAVVDDLAQVLRDQLPPTGKPGKPHPVEFIWKIVDTDGTKRDVRTGQIEESDTS